VRVKTRACVALMLLTAAAGVAGCGENNDQRQASNTVSRFYAALKRHDAVTACSLVSPAFAAASFGTPGARRKPCVVALRGVFRRVAVGPNPRLFDSVPKVVSVTAHGDHATVVIGQGYQRRHLDLTRSGGRWLITDSPDLR
jgi:ketosteroid isomerase-like protein